MGLPADVAAALAAQTVRGTGELVVTSDESPAVLRQRVTSPGGTTLAGLNALKEHGLHEALVAAIRAATERSVQLGDQ